MIGAYLEIMIEAVKLDSSCSSASNNPRCGKIGDGSISNLDCDIHTHFLCTFVRP